MTIKEIAKKANVSPAAVSFVLNNKPGVSDETRAKVLKIIDESGYVPKQSSSEQKTNSTILVLSYRNSGDILNNKTSFFSSLISQLENDIRSNGYYMIYLQITDYLEYQTFIDNLSREQLPAGIILLATEMREEQLELFKNTKIPLILFDNNFLGKCVRFPIVGMDNISSAFDATEYLIKAGHERIGHLKSSTSLNNFTEREYGYSISLASHGISPSEKNCISIPPYITDCLDLIQNYMGNSTPEERATAFFADNDFIAINAVKAFDRIGVKVPDDISIISHDNTDLARLCSPELTSMNVNHSCYSGMVVDELIRMIRNNKKEFSSRKTLMVVDVFEGKSVRRI